MIVSVLSVALLFTVVPAAKPPVALAAPTYRYAERWPSPTWHLHGPSAIAFAPDGTTYVADRQNHFVRKYSADAVLLDTWGGQGNGPGMFKDPSGVAVSPDGSRVYVADTGNHRVQQFNANGDFMRSWGSAGGPDLSGSGLGEFNSPNSLAVDEAGMVYVADTGNNRIQKFDPTSEDPGWSTWGTPGTGAGQFYAPYGVAVDRFGHVFVVEGNSSYKTSRVQRFSTGGEFQIQWGAWSVNTGGKGTFRVPKGVACDAAGNVYVADSSGHVVQKFSNDGVFERQWGGFYGSGAQFSEKGEFKSPIGVGVDPEGNVWVADSGYDRFQKFTPEGQLLAVHGSWGTIGGYFYYAADAAVSPVSGDVYVVSRDSNCVQRFDSRGDFISGWPSPSYASTKLGYFDEPTGIAVGPDGSVYTIEIDNNRVQKFAPDGTFVTAWGEGLSGTGWFRDPMDIAVGSDGSVYVADTGNNRIQKFTPEGAFVTKWGTVGSDIGQLQGPQGVAVAPNGDVWVADTGNHRIQRFDASGNNPVSFGSFGSGPGNFSSPMGIAVDSSGNVYVADRDNDRVQKFRSDGTFVAQFGTSGAEAGQLNRPTGVSIGVGGRIYVADCDNHRVEVFVESASVEVLGIEDGGVYNGPVTPEVRFSFATEESVELDGSAWTPSTVSAEGEHSLYVWCTDGSYEDSATIEFIIDKTDPTTSGDVKARYTDAATIKLTATDALSGVARTFYRIDGGTAQQGTKAEVSTPGNHTIEYWSEDRAGNVETAKSASFTIVPTIEHDAAGVVFDRWITGYSSAYSGGGYVYGRWSGTQLSARFSGTKIKWIGPKQPNYGMADVYIDGVKAGSVDCYAPVSGATLSTTVWESGTLPAGDHTVSIRLTGNKNAASTGFFVVVDRFEAEGATAAKAGTRIDDSSAAPGCTGSWLTAVNPTYYNKTYRYSRWSSAAFTATFTGTKVAWIGPRTTDYGKADVYIDNVKVATVDQYRANLATQGWREVVWESSTLPAGTHMIKIVPTGTKNAASTAANIVVDAIDAW